MPANVGFKNIGIAGLGLIGGSFAKAFSANGINVYGYDTSLPTIEKGAFSGIFQGITDDFNIFIKFPLDLVYICLPVQAALIFIEKLGLSNIKIPVTDASSTKKSVSFAAQNAKLDFCGGHPIKGKETSGFENSEASLFQNAKHILTPGENEELANALRILHESIGMRVFIMDADSHDDILGLVSHLPHLASFCLMDTVAEKRSEAFNFAGGGFMDFTRIAASDPVMWADIFTDNKNSLLNCVSALEKSVKKWKNLIENDDYEKLKQNIQTVSNIRRLL